MAIFLKSFCYTFQLVDDKGKRLRRNHWKWADLFKVIDIGIRCLMDPLTLEPTHILQILQKISMQFHPLYQEHTSNVWSTFITFAGRQACARSIKTRCAPTQSVNMAFRYWTDGGDAAYRNLSDTWTQALHDACAAAQPSFLRREMVQTELQMYCTFATWLLYRWHHMHWCTLKTCL